MSQGPDILRRIQGGGKMCQTKIMVIFWPVPPQIAAASEHLIALGPSTLGILVRRRSLQPSRQQHQREIPTPLDKISKLSMLNPCQKLANIYPFDLLEILTRFLILRKQFQTPCAFDPITKLLNCTASSCRSSGPGYNGEGTGGKQDKVKSILVYTSLFCFCPCVLNLHNFA